MVEEPIFRSSISFCDQATIKDLKDFGKVGEQYMVYDSENAIHHLDDNTPLTTGTYYIAKLESGCLSTLKEVSVTLDTPEPDLLVTYTDTEYCQDEVVDFTLENTIPGFLYSIQDDQENVIKPAVEATGSQLSFSLAADDLKENLKVITTNNKSLLINQNYYQIDDSQIDQKLDLNQGTIEAWIKLKGNLPVSGFRLIAGKVGSYALFLNNGRLASFIWGNGQTITDTQVLPIDEWIHIAYTFDASSGQARLYKNGDLVGSRNDFSKSATLSPFTIGTNPGAILNQNYQHHIDELRVWDVVKSAVQIEQNATSCIQLENSALKLLVNFDDIADEGVFESVNRIFITDLPTNGVSSSRAIAVIGNTQVCQPDFCGDISPLELNIPVLPILNQPQGANQQVFCILNPTLADLDIIGTSLKYYADASLTELLQPSELIEDDAVYYITQSNSKCESEALEVSVRLLSNAPVSNPIQEFCGDGFRISDLVAFARKGGDIIWFDDATSTTPLDPTDFIVSGTYYAAEQIDDCVSPSRAEVVVNTSGGIESIAISIDSEDICFGETSNITIPDSQLGVRYYLTDQNDQPLGPEALGNGSTLTLTTPVISSAQTVKVLAENIPDPNVIGAKHLIDAHLVESTWPPETSPFALEKGTLEVMVQIPHGTNLLNATYFIAGKHDAYAIYLINARLATIIYRPDGSQQVYTSSSIIFPGQWHQVSLTFDKTLNDGSNNWALYQNGNELISGNDFTQRNLESPFSINTAVTRQLDRLHSSTFQYDFLRVWDDAFTSEQVASLNGTCFKERPDGLVFTTNFSGSNPYQDPIAGLSLLQFSSNVVDVSGSRICFFDCTLTLASFSLNQVLVDAPLITENQSFCATSSPTVADIVTDPNDVLNWYILPTMLAVSSTDLLVNNTQYLARKVINGCESEDGTTVQVVLTDPIPPIVASPQFFCEGATVSQLTASGENLEWFASLTAEVPLSSTQMLENGTYYLASTGGGCVNERVAVEVQVNPIALISSTTTSAPTSCNAFGLLTLNFENVPDGTLRLNFPNSIGIVDVSVVSGVASIGVPVGDHDLRIQDTNLACATNDLITINVPDIAPLTLEVIDIDQPSICGALGVVNLQINRPFSGQIVVSHNTSEFIADFVNGSAVVELPSGNYNELSVWVEGCINSVKPSLQVNSVPAPVINVDQINQPTACGESGELALSFEFIPDGLYTLLHNNGSFEVNVSGGEANVSLAPGTYGDLTLQLPTGCTNDVRPWVIIEDISDVELFVDSFNQPNTCSDLGIVNFGTTNVPDGTYNVSHDNGSFSLQITAGSGSASLPVGEYLNLSLEVAGGCTNSIRPSINLEPLEPIVLNISQVIAPTTCNGLGTINFTTLFVPDGTYALHYLGGMSTLVLNSGNGSIELPEGNYEEFHITLSNGCTNPFRPSASIAGDFDPIVTIEEVAQPQICGDMGIITLGFQNVPDGTYDITHDNGSFSMQITAGSGSASLPIGEYFNLSIEVAGGCTNSILPSVTLEPLEPIELIINTIISPDACGDQGEIQFNTVNVADGTYDLIYQGGMSTLAINNGTGIVSLDQGVYTELHIVLPNGCSNPSRPSATIEAANNPVITLLEVNHPEACGELGEVLLGFQNVPDGNYLLNFKDGNMSGLLVIDGQASLLLSGTVLEEIWIEVAGGCTNSVRPTIVVNGPPAPTLQILSIVDPEECEGLAQLEFSVQNLTDGVYEIVTDDQGFSPIFVSEGRFNISLLSENYSNFVLTNDECSTEPINFELDPFELEATVQLVGEKLVANQLSGASYQWIDCENNNNPISGETNFSFNPATSGTYAVIIPQGSCSDTSHCVEVTLNNEDNGNDDSGDNGDGDSGDSGDDDSGGEDSDDQAGDDEEDEELITSIATIEMTNALIYPNPSNGAITINLNYEAQEVKVMIRDLSGRTLQESSFAYKQYLKVDWEGKPGLYLIEVHDVANGSSIQKRIIRR
ncbi:MAG: T9SS type A sorting domain-containing protein [Cyclobacteriaceae bacterium]|nr:T9SS type A sorting domain-containing protein [Cyclobacteriaceae bacterium]MCH8514872.1 T9SS type A sorting domain-containing protein [Cyclobacteriaceae bacterium]